MLLRQRNKKHYDKHKDLARKVVHARIAYYNTFFGHKLNKVFIKNTKSRWGSCSSKGNLNFNYKLLFLPQEVCDYVIVHELCHLVHFNHSKEFWALVATVCPNYRAYRRALMQY